MNLYNYRARPVRVIDGDTVVLDIDLGLHVHLVVACRLWGINAPEMKGETPEAAKSARNALVLALEADHVAGFDSIWIHSFELDKYGRPLVIIYREDVPQESIWGASVNAAMIASGHAVDIRATLREKTP